jgi:hypothetical protein
MGPRRLRAIEISLRAVPTLRLVRSEDGKGSLVANWAQAILFIAPADPPRLTDDAARLLVQLIRRAQTIAEAKENTAA